MLNRYGLESQSVIDYSELDFFFYRLELYYIIFILKKKEGNK